MRRVRSLMLAMLAVVVLVWFGVLGWRRAQFLALAGYFREHASNYARAEAENAFAVAEVAEIEHEVAFAEPPSARADDGAWRAYRGYLSDLQTKLNNEKSSLDVYEHYRALHRYAQRLAAKYEFAATRPWVDVVTEAPND
jgi:hypothetical protein